MEYWNTGVMKLIIPIDCVALFNDQMVDPIALLSFFLEAFHQQNLPSPHPSPQRGEGRVRGILQYSIYFFVSPSSPLVRNFRTVGSLDSASNFLGSPLAVIVRLSTSR